MKEPKKGMSSMEFSFFVVRLCLMLGCISMIIVLCTSGETFTMAYEMFMIVIMAIVAVACLLSFIFEIIGKRRKENKK